MLQPNGRKVKSSNRINIYLSDSAAEKLDNLSNSLGYSRGELIRLLIEEEYDHQMLAGGVNES